MVSLSAFFDSSGELDSSCVIFTAEPDAARREREPLGCGGGLETEVRFVRALVDRRIGMVVCVGRNDEEGRNKNCFLPNLTLVSDDKIGIAIDVIANF